MKFLKENDLNFPDRTTYYSSKSFGFRRSFDFINDILYNNNNYDYYFVRRVECIHMEKIYEINSVALKNQIYENIK